MANKNQALSWVINEDDSRLYLCTIYGLIDVSKIITLTDDVIENNHKASLTVKLEAIKWVLE